MSTITHPALASRGDLRNHAGVGQTLRNTVTMAARSLMKIRRPPEQLIDVTLQPVLFTVMFAFLFGGAISGSIEDYLPILIPGILMQTVIIASVTTGVQLREDMDKGVFDRFRSLPIARISPLSGALLADTVRYALATTITFATGYAIGFRAAAGPWSLVAAGLLMIVTAWSISWIFALFGVTARSASAVQGISFLVLFPLTFLSNAFVPVDTLPDWMKWLADNNPLSHLVTAVRGIVNDGTFGADGWITLVSAAVIVAIFAPLTVRAYMRRA